MTSRIIAAVLLVGGAALAKDVELDPKEDLPGTSVRARGIDFPEGLSVRAGDMELKVIERDLALAKRTEDLRGSLERAYAAAGRCYFKTDAEHEAWVEARGLVPDSKDRRFLRKGFFDAEAWQRWVEDELWKPLREESQRQEDFERRSLGASAERASIEARILVSSVVKLAQRYSKEIHDRSGLAVPAALREPRSLPGEEAPVSADEFSVHRATLEASLPAEVTSPRGP